MAARPRLQPRLWQHVHQDLVGPHAVHQEGREEGEEEGKDDPVITAATPVVGLLLLIL